MKDTRGKESGERTAFDLAAHKGAASLSPRLVAERGYPDYCTRAFGERFANRSRKVEFKVAKLKVFLELAVTRACLRWQAMVEMTERWTAVLGTASRRHGWTMFDGFDLLLKRPASESAGTWARNWSANCPAGPGWQLRKWTTSGCCSQVPG